MTTSSTAPQRPEFATNSGSGPARQTVAGALNGLLAGARASGALSTQLAIATAYFNLDGWCLLADELEQTSGVRLLLGAEPVDAVLHRTVVPLAGRPTNRRRAVTPGLAPAVERHERALAGDRDLLGFTAEADAKARRLVRWLSSGEVEVRRLTSEFLHGKAFLLDTWASAAIAGSANLTYAGLSVNHELDLGVYAPTPVGQVKEWFDGLWDRADPFDLAALYTDRREVQQPIDVFLRMLWERYGDDEEPQTAAELGLPQFQVDGVWRAQRLLDERRGVIIADEVGLGKTFLAGELIRRASIERRQKVLVIAPATLRDSTWKPFLAARNLPGDVVSYDQLVSQIDSAGRAGSPLRPLDEYAMVVVDEAHNLRTATTQRAQAMRTLLGGQAPKDLVLLTATPVNNSLTDLQTLIGYITPADGAFADIGIPSLDRYFRAALAQAPEDLSPEHLFAVLDAVAVRRTRTFVKRYYANDTVTINGAAVPLTFPTPSVKRVEYDLDAVLPQFFARLAKALGAELADAETEPSGVVIGHEGVLTMARYVPSRFERARADDDVEQYQAQNAGLLRSALLKRFESSAEAFASTVGAMLASFDQFLAALDEGWVLTGDALRAWTSSTSDDVDAVVRSGLDGERFAEANARPASSFDVAQLRAAIEADRVLLTSLRDDVRGVEPLRDPKVLALVHELERIAAESESEGTWTARPRDRRKVLLFTYFADTARYLEGALQAAFDDAELGPRLEPYRDRMVVVTGSDTHNRQDAIAGFAPLTAGPTPDEDPSSDRFDLAIATDVLAEGVNLQQARHIVNYDLPWNPMRLVQRHGRVDRIGSPHSRIELRCFFPDAQLEVLLDLEARLQRKLHQAAVTFGTAAVLPDVAAVERTITETRDDIERLRNEDAGVLDGTRGAASSGEEFRRRLARAFASETTRERVTGMAWGSGTGFVRAGGRPGIVFCARIADHDQRSFRFVELDEHRRVLRRDDGAAVVDDDVLACLVAADPGGDDAVGHLDDALREVAFEAWGEARTDIAAEWERRRDPAAGAVEVPAVMRRAADLVRQHGFDLGERQDEFVTRLAQPVLPRAQREIRQVLKEHEGDPVAGVVALAAAAADLRLPIPAQPVRLPRIDPETDIHLVTWAAVVPPEV